MATDQLDSEEIVARLFQEFGWGWFTSKLAKVKLDTLKELAQQGHLDCVLAMYSSTTLNFRVKRITEP